MIRSAGAPSAGTTAVFTLTIGGTPTGGTFTLTYQNRTTAAITWSSTNATLVANIDAALEALPGIGTGNMTTAVGTMTSGVGTITLTFAGTLAKSATGAITVGTNSLTGTSPTVAIAETTPGVNATGLGRAKGTKLVDTTNGIDYINTGTRSAPTWTKTGTQT